MIIEETLKEITGMLDSFNPITLKEMSRIRLMNRTDTKYLLPLDTLAVLLKRAACDYRCSIHSCLNDRLLQFNR